MALARKIAVLAWALLRDEKDWEPKRMIEITESFGKMPANVKEALQAMKPKENSDQRKSRLRKEARLAREASSDATRQPTKQPSATTSQPKTRRARKPVSPAGART